MSTLVQKPVGEFEILPLSGGLEQFHEGKLYLLVPGHPVTLAGTEDGHHMVRHPDADVEQLTFPCHVVVGHSCLYHMACTVHLVLIHIVPAVLKAGKGIIGVDISVFLLGGGELVYPLVAFRLKHRIGIVLQGISHTLECLVDIGIVKEYSRMFSFSLGRILEVADTAGLVLDLVDAHLEGHVLVALETRGPESVVNLHLRELYRGDHFQVGILPPAAGNQCGNGQEEYSREYNCAFHLYKLLGY